jgi:DNA-directed RNA polymerase subunit L
MKRYVRFKERKNIFTKQENNFITQYDKALNTLYKSSRFFESTVRDNLGFIKTLQKAYNQLFAVSYQLEEIVHYNMEDYTLYFLVEVLYRTTGHKFTNYTYTHNIKHNLKSLIIDLDNFVIEPRQEVLLSSIKSEYNKICGVINDFVIEYNKKFIYKDYKKLIIPYEEINFFHKK